MPSINPSRDSIAQLAQKLPAGKPFVMLNLLRFNDEASYPESEAHAPCSGREAYKRYSKAAIKKLQEIGAEPVWMAEAVASVIAPDGEHWDEVLLVKYPSPDAFLQMLSMPDYQAATVHRTAALADSRLIATVDSPSA